MYADYEFYTNEYLGNKITAEDFPRLALRASDFLDFATGNKMIDNLPSDTASLNKIKKACCAVADEMSDMSKAGSSAEATGTGGGIIKSLSSGGESITYELTAAAKAAAAGSEAVQRHLYGIAKSYLSLVSDDNGNYYLYRGLD